jgi:hypothetical protein
MTAFDDAWGEVEQEIGPLLSDELSNQAPVGDPEFDPESGTLAASMKWEDQGGEFTAGSSDPRGPISVYVARGTRQHDITAVNAPFLHFYWPAQGRWVTAKTVHHPGTVANPFHVRAWEAQRDAVTTLFRQKMGHDVTLSYLNPWRNADLSK